jgi:hypothetical protein
MMRTEQRGLTWLLQTCIIVYGTFYTQKGRVWDFFKMTYFWSDVSFTTCTWCCEVVAAKIYKSSRLLHPT